VNFRRQLLSGMFTLLILAAAYFVNVFLQLQFHTQTLIPMVFVLAVFIISVKTTGYFWGTAATVISVLAVNFSFTYPYYAFDLITPECLSSAVVMFVVSTVTSMMTTKIKTQEKMKAEAEKERMRGNLLRAVSHDLRTPLTGIYGACSTVLDNYDELTHDQRKKLLRDIRSDAQWLVRMVENLLSITKINEDRVRIRKVPTVLEELIDTVLVKFRKHYPEQPVRVSIPEEFVSIPMDAMLITQVMMNMLENAVHHARGMTDLLLEVVVCGNTAVFRIVDNGCGIDDDKLERLFAGIHDTHTPADSGRSNMGIGLSACAAIIHAHSGEIKARNLPEGGAELSFTLSMEERNEGK